MNRYLLMINEQYPFEKAEPFLETEVKYIHGFNDTFIIPCSVTNYSERRIVNNVNLDVIQINKSTSSLKKTILYLCSLFSKEVLKEIIYLIKNRKLNISTMKTLLSFVSVGNEKVKEISNILSNKGIQSTDNIVFYSYWMHFHAYVAIKLRRKYVNSKVISRCHRFDLYEEKSVNNYIPMRRYLLNNIDTVFAISNDGKEYLKEKYDLNCDIIVSRLGTNDYGIREVNLKRRPLKIVSCSMLVPVKRVHRIIDCLSEIMNLDIEWTHYGNGYMMKNMENKANEKLKGKNNIKFIFKGHVNNSELMEIYKKDDYHVFINVSESEGIPVTFMEALSFGIPIIATNVGGNNEIIYENRNGNMLDKDFTNDEFNSLIKKFYEMPCEEYLKYREESRKVWEEEYSAKINYNKFYNIINEGT